MNFAAWLAIVMVPLLVGVTIARQVVGRPLVVDDLVSFANWTLLVGAVPALLIVSFWGGWKLSKDKIALEQAKRALEAERDALMKLKEESVE